MRLRPLALSSAAVLLLACGGAVTGTEAVSGDGTGESSSSVEGHATASSSASHESEQDAGVDSGELGPLAGAVYLITDDERGTWYDGFNTNLQTMTALALTSFCDGAARTVGPCCYYGPVRPPPTQVGGSGVATVAAEPNAGTITLLDVTAGSTVSTFPYSAGEYATLPMNYIGQPWQPNDLIRVTASGGSTLGAFSFEAPALTPPAVVLPETVPRTQNLPVIWEPDPNADTWTLSILDGATGAEIVCSSPEATGSVTVDATLLSEFAPGRSDQVVATATTNRYTESPQGIIQLQSTGWAGLPYVTFE